MNDTTAHPQALAGPYLEGLAQGVLRYQRCGDCGAAQTLARYVCQACGSARLAWRDANGTGTVYAVTQVRRAPSDSFRALAPYTLALVDLDEGPRVMGHAAEGVAIGDAVAARFLRHADAHLVFFYLQTC